MASLSNSVHHGYTDFSGYWEDTADYAAVTLTLLSAVDGSLCLQWANTPRNRFPRDDDVIATERFQYSASGPITKQWDHRGRWFRVVYNNASGATSSTFRDVSLNIETLYKAVPTELKTTDDSGGVTTVQSKSYSIAPTDICGNLVSTTHRKGQGTALFTQLSDRDGTSLSFSNNRRTGPGSLNVAIRDGQNRDLSDTSGQIYVVPSDASGHAQAGTRDVSGAWRRGPALYLAGAGGAAVDSNVSLPWSSTNTKLAVPSVDGNNAVYVALNDGRGTSIGRANPVPMRIAREGLGLRHFDFEFGLTERLVSYGDMSNGVVTLSTVFIYNDGPTPVWAKIYDISTGSIAPNGTDFSVYNRALKYNLAVPARQTRDLTFPRGVYFVNGVHIRATNDYSYDSSWGPGLDTVFVNGSYAHLRDRTLQYNNEARDLAFDNVPLADPALLSIDEIMREMQEEAAVESSIPEQMPATERSVTFSLTDGDGDMDATGAEPEAVAAAPGDGGSGGRDDVEGGDDGDGGDGGDGGTPPIEADLVSSMGLPDIPSEQSRLIKFNSADSSIRGEAKYIYKIYDELMSMNILISDCVTDVTGMTIHYTDETSASLDIGIGIDDFLVGTPLYTAEISMTQRELETASLVISFADGKRITVPWTAVNDGVYVA